MRLIALIPLVFASPVFADAYDRPIPQAQISAVQFASRIVHRDDYIGISDQNFGHCTPRINTKPVSKCV